MTRNFSGIVFFLLILTTFLAGCANEKNKLVGVWKVSDVKTNFDESKVNPATLQQVAELEKQTVLKFANDTSLVIMMGERNFSAFYTFDKPSGKIFYSFDGRSINMNELGIYKDETIVSSSETPVGMIEVIYLKSN